MSTLIEWLNNNAGAIQSLATFILVLVTAIYVILTRKIAVVAQQQLDIQKPSVLAYVETQSGLPCVNITNTGHTTAYEVLVNIDWPNPPEGLDGNPKSVESPTYGKPSPGDTIAFKSPHKIDVRKHFKKSTEYIVLVKIRYYLIARGKENIVNYQLDYGKHIRKMRSSRQAPKDNIQK
jgi:hypothetical protein